MAAPVQNQFIMDGEHFTTLPRSEWPSTSGRAFFFYQTKAPATIYASVVNAASSDDSEEATFMVTCGGTSCDNFPVQTITHANGSSWAGRHEATGTVTSWGCNLGSGSEDTIPNQLGICSSATAAVGAKLDMSKQTAVNECFVDSRSAYVILTAGVEKMYSLYPPMSGDETAEQWSARWKQDFDSSVCPAGTSATATPNAAQPSQTSSSASGKSPQTAQASPTAPSPSKPTTATSSGANAAKSTGKNDGLSSGSSRSLVLLFGSALLGALVSI